RRADGSLADAGDPPLLELAERRVREDGDLRRLDHLPTRLRDRVARPVADLQEALRRSAAAAGQTVAAVLLREGDAELFEPVDRRGRFGRQHLDEPQVGRLVRAAPDVLRVALRRVLLAERGLDAAL